jgi:gas vesicle protein
MQAAAIGALAAYPVMALARRIPAPLMMIGAGLFLMNSETGRNLSQKATERAEDLAEQGQRMAHDWRDKSADTLSSVVEQASSVGASIRGSVSETADDARRYAAHLGSTVGESVSDARRSVSETAEDARRYAAHLGSTVDDNISDARRSMRDADYGQSMRDLRGNAMNSVQATVGATTDALTSWARENPVLTAVIGMAVGGLVASAIPVTRAEVRLAETATGDLRRRFGDVVTTAQGAVDQAAERTAQQGLTPESIADASRDFGERALKVAEAAAGAALSRTDQQDNTHTPAGA